MARIESPIQKIIMASRKRNEAKRDQQQKQKSEIMKLLLQSQIKQREAEHASGLKQKEEQAKLATPKHNTPEQRHLMQRYLEENPLAAMAVPEAGQAPITTPLGEQTQWISYPSSEVTQDKTGRYQQQPLSQERQATLLFSKVEQMQAAGKRVHPAVLKVANLMKLELQRKQYVKENKSEITQMQRRLAALNKQIHFTPTQELKDARDEIRKRLNLVLGVGGVVQPDPPDEENVLPDDEVTTEDEEAFNRKWGI